MDSPPSPNTAYTAHFVRPNFGFAETSHMLGPLYEIGGKVFEIVRMNVGEKDGYKKNSH